MLVLSRKSSERIHIGDSITVEVRRVAGNRVTLAIDAPRDIRILRGELERVAKEFEEEAATQEAPASDANSIATSETSADESPSVSITAALPANDMSDHGMTAYAI